MNKCSNFLQLKRNPAVTTFVTCPAHPAKTTLLEMRQTEQKQNIGRFPSMEPLETVFPATRAILPESAALVALAAGVLWHLVPQALTHSVCVCVTTSVRKANEVIIHSLGSLLAILTALSVITCTCDPPETPGHTCTGFLYLL